MPNEEENTIPSRFERRVREMPSRAALVFGNQTFTFDELNRFSNHIAHQLLGAGLMAEDRVGILLERSVESVGSILGILKAGGAYVPLDVSYPNEVVQRLARDSGLRFLITREAQAVAFRVSGAALLLLNDADKWRNCKHNPNVAVRPENLAYLIYTSGSSGKPKGVMVQHRSVMNLLEALRERIYSRYSRQLRIGLNASLMFDASVKQWIQLLDGHTICIFPADIRRSEQLWKYVAEAKVDLLDTTPSQLRYLLGGTTKTGTTPPPVVLVGGEAIAPEMWESFQDWRETDFYNLYGPTECTVDATACKVSDLREPSLGPPLLNIQTYLLDKDLEPVHSGTTGEIYIGGMGVARGYWQDPGQTAERFLPDPFSSVPGSRLYQTGDMAFQVGDRLVFEGRKDDQVKVNGYRVELAEIANTLRELDSIQDAIALVSEQQIAAFVIFKPDAAVGLEQVREEAARSLPYYMTPRHILAVRKWPLTDNGKLNRRALLDLVRSTEKSPASERAPQFEVEHTLAGIWRQVLGPRDISYDKNFFDAGGDSFQLGQVYEIVRDTMCPEISIAEMFEFPTISALAQHLSETAERVSARDSAANRASRRRMAVANGEKTRVAHE